LYKLYLDKQELFEADIQIEGANSNSAKCRLVIETPTINLFCEGNISNNKCKISIPKLNSILNESLTGKIKLEVIVDDALFTPWSSTYQTKLNTKVTAEIAQPIIENKGPKIIATVKENNNNTIVNLITEQLRKYKITYYNLQENIGVVKKISSILSKKYNLTPDKFNSYVLESLETIDRA